MENDANGSCLSFYDAGSGNNRQSHNRMVVNATNVCFAVRMFDDSYVFSSQTTVCTSINE
jgi:hypothetical protein